MVIVSEYIYIPWKHSQDQAALLAAARGGDFASSTPSVSISTASDAEAQEVSYLKEQVSKVASWCIAILLLILHNFNKKIFVLSSFLFILICLFCKHWCT